MQADEEYLIGQNFGPRGLSAIPLDLDGVIGRISAKRGNGLPGCAGTNTCTEEILEKTGYHGIYPIPGHGGPEVMQQPRGGEQQRPYGPDGPVAMIWPKGGQTDTGLDPYGRVRSTRSTEYCAGVNTCCTSPPCDEEEPYRTHLRDDEGGPRHQDQCACVYHEDQKHPTEYRKPEIICAGISNSNIGAWYEGTSLLPQKERKENWSYDTRRNWTEHSMQTKPSATENFQIHQPGDYKRQMDYSPSDQPTVERLWTYEEPALRTFNIFHDKRGNLLDDGRKVFEYDALNRLTGVWQSARGGQPSGPGSEFEPGTKGHPIAAFTYDGYGHRLTARYNVNNNTVIDDDPVDVYAYDRLWRVRTLTRATPSGSSAEATWTWYVREKWYYHDTESGQEMMTGPNSTDAPIMRLIDRNGDGDFNDPGEEQHFVNDHQGSTVLVTGKATLDPANGNLISRAPIIAHVKYDQYGVPKFVHPADVNSDGVVDAADSTFWRQAWNEYVNGASGQTPPKEIWKGVVDANEDGSVDTSADPVNSSLPSSTNADWLAFNALHIQGMAQGEGYLVEQLGNLPLYAGYWWDDAIGLYHVRHRVYRPEWGRWLQRDPLGYAPGWNLYQYVNGMPWRSVDPMGLESFPFEWHHELPQSIFGPDGYLAGEGIRIPGIDQDFIDQSDYGSIMRWNDHRGTGNMATHIEYNNAWKSWLKEQIETGKSITKDSVLHQLNKYREGSSFKDWLGKGKRATHSYKEWGGKSNADKIKWLIKEGENLLSKDEIKSFREVLRAAQRSGTAIKFVHVFSEGVKGVGKVAKVLTPIIIVANIASGEEVVRATVDGLLPVDIDTIDELRHDGLTIIDESLNQRRYRVHRGTDSLLHELTGIPQNERTPLSSVPSCNPR